MLGSTPGSSYASEWLSKKLPYRSPTLKRTTRKVVASVAGKKVANKIGTAVVGRFLGRLVPGVGWGLLAGDIYSLRTEIKEFADGVREANQEIKETYGTAGYVCFTKGTLIYTKNRHIPIDSLKIGDLVYSYNFENNIIEESQVVNKIHSEVNSIYKICLENESILVTAEHPFYVFNKGWIPVKELKLGDKLRLSTNNGVEIKDIKISNVKTIVYNIEVEKNNNFFITNMKILVHNKNIRKFLFNKKK